MTALDTHSAGSKRGSAVLWFAAALVVFCISLVTPFSEVWRYDVRETVPTFPWEEPGDSAWPKRLKGPRTTDHYFVTWGVGRNAYTLLTRPTRLFDGEQCYPAPNALALGEPMITLGIVGMPAYFVTRNPVATFNFAIVFTTLLAAVAMYVLVAEWTAIPAAGIVAGVLYAFNAVKMRNVVHPYVDDTAWTVLALLLARRFFAHGRRRDAIGAAVACSLQIGASFYPFLAATVFAVPILGWLIVRYGIRNLRVAPTLVAVGIIGFTAAVVFLPYLEWRSSADVLRREFQLFIGWEAYLPRGIMFPGWVLPVLVLLSLVLPRKRMLGGLDGDPRWALVIAAVLVALMATGGNWAARLAAAFSGAPPPIELPNLYELLAIVIPGLDSVRVPGALSAGVHVALSILAGLGAAALIAMAPARLRTSVAIALILIAYVETLRPRVIGLEPPVIYRPVLLKPADGVLEFYETLAEKGNSGPILELPYKTGVLAGPTGWLSAYHHRRTSACHATFPPPVVSEVRELSERLPDQDAIRAAREMGFTTIVLRHASKGLASSYGERFEEASQHGGLLRRIHGDTFMTAYAIEPGDSRESTDNPVQ